MKTIFDEETRQEIIQRINSLSESRKRQWGKMTLFQMMKHCTSWDEWVQGKGDFIYKQSFLGLIFGRMALKGMVNNNRPMKRNMPAGVAVEKERVGDVELQKKLWIDRVSDYASYSNPDFIHDFFGHMTREEIGIFAYKHADHHLRQFSS